QRQHDVRHIDAFALGERPADHDFGIGEILAATYNLQPQLPIVEQKVGARLERREDLAMRQISACRIAGLIDEIEPEGRAFLERRGARLKGADAQLRPLHVGEHADRTSGLALDFADLDEAFSMLIVRAVAEVQPEYIDAGHEQSPDRVFGRARWPEG